LLNTNDLNPYGKSLYNAISLLSDLYKFKSIPSLTEKTDYTKGVKFEDGEFANKKGDIIFLTLVVHNDGIIVDTRSSTSDADDFLDEILTKMSEKFNLPHYKQLAVKKAYVSKLYITTEILLELFNPKLKEISEYLTDNLSHPFELGCLGFWPDQTVRLSIPPFIFERATNFTFSEKRYFSSAPLQTDKHLEMLNKLEKIFLKK